MITGAGKPGHSFSPQQFYHLTTYDMTVMKGAKVSPDARNYAQTGLASATSPFKGNYALRPQIRKG